MGAGVNSQAEDPKAKAKSLLAGGDETSDRQQRLRTVTAHATRAEVRGRPSAPGGLIASRQRHNDRRGRSGGGARRTSDREAEQAQWSHDLSRTAAKPRGDVRAAPQARVHATSGAPHTCRKGADMSADIVNVIRSCTRYLSNAASWHTLSPREARARTVAGAAQIEWPGREPRNRPNQSGRNTMSRLPVRPPASTTDGSGSGRRAAAVPYAGQPFAAPDAPDVRTSA
jgi:hypothetical protein